MKEFKNIFKKKEEKCTCKENPKLKTFCKKCNTCWNCKKDITTNQTPCEQCKPRKEHLEKQKIPIMDAYTKINEKETLTFLEKYAFKKAIKKALKQYPKYRKEFSEGMRQKDEIIEKILELATVLNIEDEVKYLDENGKEKIKYVPIDKEMLETKPETELLNDLEDTLKEAMKLV